MNGIEIVRTMELKQEPPRKRSYLGANGEVHTAEFPWVSTGGLCYQYVGNPHRLPGRKPSEHFDRKVFAYFHDRPLERIEDAEEVLHLAPAAFHSQAPLGDICCGSMYLAFSPNTPAELFWMTQNKAPRTPAWACDMHPWCLFRFNSFESMFQGFNIFPWDWGAAEIKRRMER